MPCIMKATRILFLLFAFVSLIITSYCASLSINDVGKYLERKEFVLKNNKSITFEGCRQGFAHDIGFTPIMTEDEIKEYQENYTCTKKSKSLSGHMERPEMKKEARLMLNSFINTLNDYKNRLMRCEVNGESDNLCLSLPSIYEPARKLSNERFFADTYFCKCVEESKEVKCNFLAIYDKIALKLMKEIHLEAEKKLRSDVTLLAEVIKCELYNLNTELFRYIFECNATAVHSTGEVFVNYLIRYNQSGNNPLTEENIEDDYALTTAEKDIYDLILDNPKNLTIDFVKACETNLTIAENENPQLILKDEPANSSHKMIYMTAVEMLVFITLLKSLY